MNQANETHLFHHLLGSKMIYLTLLSNAQLTYFVRFLWCNAIKENGPNISGVTFLGLYCY